MSADPPEADPAGALADVLSDCGFTRYEIPDTGPGSTYVVVIVPHPDNVWPDEVFGEEVDEDLGEPGLDGSTAVRVYAIPDAHISADQRGTLRRADGVDMAGWVDDIPTDPDSREAAALRVAEWVTGGPWAGRLAYCYNNDPLSYHGRTAPDRPTTLVTITLPAAGFDPTASNY